MAATVLPSARSRWRGVQAPALVAGGVLGASILLHLRDPHRGGSWGLCPWLLLTGTYCPGCGGLRAVNDLTRGDLAGAASSNLLLVGSLPLVVTWWCRRMLLGWRGVTRAVPVRRAVLGVMLFATAALAFAVLRNTAAGSWLAP